MMKMDIFLNAALNWDIILDYRLYLNNIMMLAKKVETLQWSNIM